MKNIIFKIIISIIIILLLVIVYCLAQVYLPTNSISQPADFTITQGEGVKIIGAHLKQINLINSQFIFETLVYLRQNETKFLAGKYSIKSPISLNQLVDLLTTNPLSQDKEIKVLEGWSVQQIGQYLENNGYKQTEELLEVVGFPTIDYRQHPELPKLVDFTKQYQFLQDKPTWLGLEGYLFPDTYRVYYNFSVEDLTRKMLNNFDKKLTVKMRQEIDRQERTIFEVITMASLIEKEASNSQDKKIVADVFYKRLLAGMSLQSCATVNYLLGRPKEQLTYQDIKIVSPYNTYLHAGLPPGPICNPGIDSIEAAIWPTKTEYWYFLSDPTDINLIFSKNKAEHDRNKIKYLSN